jgi:predicted nucleic acid-binding protein
VTRVLLDVNVVLDVLANREPFVSDAEIVLRLVESGRLEGLLAAHTVTTLHFLLSRHLGKARSKRVLDDLLQITRIVAVDDGRIRHALAMNWADFEDAVQAACAEQAEAEYLVTRDKKGFRHSVVKVVTPAELIAVAS